MKPLRPAMPINPVVNLKPVGTTLRGEDDFDVRLDFTGRVLVYPDEIEPLYVGDEDVIFAITTAAKGLSKPIRASLYIDTPQPHVGRLEIERGSAGTCNDPDCCSDADQPGEFKVGELDVVRALLPRDGQTITLSIGLQGWRVPMVEVTAAHPLRKVFPDRRTRIGETFTVTAARAVELAREGGITRESMSRAEQAYRRDQRARARV